MASFVRQVVIATLVIEAAGAVVLGLQFHQACEPATVHAPGIVGAAFVECVSYRPSSTSATLVTASKVLNNLNPPDMT